jgi:hypothetical protein
VDSRLSALFQIDVTPLSLVTSRRKKAHSLSTLVDKSSEPFLSLLVCLTVAVAEAIRSKAGAVGARGKMRERNSSLDYHQLPRGVGTVGPVDLGLDFPNPRR